MNKIKRISPRFLIAALLAMPCVGGCRQESREYLQGLETKDRLIQRSDRARKDMIDSLASRSLHRADLAMGADSELLEQNLYVDGQLDSFRPHVPSPTLYAQAVKLAKSLEQDHKNLLSAWVDASRDTNPDTARELSSKIRDVEIALVEATEMAKRSRPRGASSLLFNEDELAPEEQR